jgi:hypothetical protein
MRILVEDRSGNQIELTVNSNGLAIVRLNGVHKGHVRWDKGAWDSTIRFDQLPDGIIAGPPEPPPEPKQLPFEGEGLVFFFNDDPSVRFYDPPKRPTDKK